MPFLLTWFLNSVHSSFNISSTLYCCSHHRRKKLLRPFFMAASDFCSCLQHSTILWPTVAEFSTVTALHNGVSQTRLQSWSLHCLQPRKPKTLPFTPKPTTGNRHRNQPQPSIPYCQFFSSSSLRHLNQTKPAFHMIFIATAPAGQFIYE